MTTRFNRRSDFFRQSSSIGITKNKRTRSCLCCRVQAAQGIFPIRFITVKKMLSIKEDRQTFLAQEIE